MTDIPPTPPKGQPISQTSQTTHSQTLDEQQKDSALKFFQNNLPSKLAAIGKPLEHSKG